MPGSPQHKVEGEPALRIDQRGLRREATSLYDLESLLG